MELDFNENWLFFRDGDKPVPVTLPHDAMLNEPRRSTCRNGVNSGYFPGGKYRYEKRFVLDAAQIGKSIVLHFEGVYQNATVTVNGEEACRHRYGYTAFDADISELVQTGENTVSVTVDNSLEPNCRWYSGSGIYRPVTMIVREKAYIRTLRIRTVSIDPAIVRIETDAQSVEIFDGEERIASGKPGIITIPNAKLWSAEHPHLYTCVVKTETDEKREHFGIRELRWSAETGFTVNGETVKLRGGCIHHDHGVLGACEYREAEERRIRILKENGFNAVRVAHNPASRVLLETCDRIGMYVMDEAFDGWYTPKTYHDYARYFETDWQNDLAAMVDSAYNHPCVILYSVGNEVTETASERGIAVCAKMRDYVHELDDSRPVTAGINVLLDVYTKRGIAIYKDKGAYRPEPLPEGKAYREKKIGSAFFNYWAGKLGGLMFFMSKGRTAGKVVDAIAPSLDVIGYNYASSRYDIDAKQHPDRLIVGSETMAADLPYNWERVEKYSQLIGDFVWSAWDYLGECCMGWTYQSYKGLPLFANQGMIDSTGKPLASMAFLETVWGLRKEPYIGVRPLNHAHETPSKGAWQFTDAIDSWTWHGYEGVKATVEVYANAAKVRLLLNEEEIGIKPVTAYKALFHVAYRAGTLTAEALDESGTVVAKSTLVTGGTETVLSVKPEKARAKTGEVIFVPIEFTDKNGELIPYAEQRVELSVGGGKLLGFGSALYKTDEVFDKPYHNTYRGRALAVVQASEPGIIQITATGAGVEPAVAEIEVEA